MRDADRKGSKVARHPGTTLSGGTPKPLNKLVRYRVTYDKVGPFTSTTDFFVEDELAAFMRATSGPGAICSPDSVVSIERADAANSARPIKTHTLSKVWVTPRRK